MTESAVKRAAVKHIDYAIARDIIPDGFEPGSPMRMSNLPVRQTVCQTQDKRQPNAFCNAL